MKNDGKEAERSFEGYWSRIGHVERLRDRKDLIAINKGLLVADFAKPSDFLVSSPKHPLHYAEVKSTVEAKSFSFSKIQTGQANAAKLEHARGSGAYIFYIFSYATGRWYVMPCKQYVDTLAEGRKSIRFEELSLWVQ